MPLMHHEEEHKPRHKNTRPSQNSMNSNQFDENEPPMPPPPKKNAGCCKRVSKFLFSHIGLVAMVILYSIAGAFLFQLLEQHEEAKECQEGKGAEETNIVNLRSQLLTYIQFNISTSSSDTSKDNETVANANIDQWLQDFRTAVNDNRDSYHYTGQDCSTSKWSFANSLLFVITVITTIGYGNITPVTWEGQVVCICYATIGIPLFLMCIANISGVLGDMFRFLYSRVCCRLCMKKKTPPPQSGGIQGQAGDFVGDGKSEMNGTRSALGIQPVSQWANNKELDGVNPKAAGYNGAKVVDDNRDFENDIKDPDEEEERVTVPLTITMIIITFYIALAALLFNLFEGWTPIEAAYFCYITLATIGFGDFVPGQKSDDPYSGAKLIAGAIYVLFGMAILAMCFDLMQEEIIAKFTWLGKKLGIVDKDEDDEAEELAAAEEKKLAEKEKALKEGGQFNKDDALRKEKPAYVANPTKEYTPNGYDSPTPGYRSNLDDDMGSSKQFRSPYLQNVVQRQQKS